MSYFRDPGEIVVRHDYPTPNTCCVEFEFVTGFTGSGYFELRITRHDPAWEGPRVNPIDCLQQQIRSWRIPQHEFGEWLRMVNPDIPVWRSESEYQRDADRRAWFALHGMYTSLRNEIVRAYPDTADLRIVSRRRLFGRKLAEQAPEGARRFGD